MSPELPLKNSFKISGDSASIFVLSKLNPANNEFIFDWASPSVIGIPALDIEIIESSDVNDCGNTASIVSPAIDQISDD